MPIVVVKFPEDNAKKVSMSRLLSKHKKRDFSVIVDIEKKDLPKIFEKLNHNDCKVLLAKDESMKIDFDIYYLLYILNKRMINEPNVEKLAKIKDKIIFEELEKDKPLKKILAKFQKKSKLYLSKFEKEFIISKNKRLYSDWEYRIRVLFDSITIQALDLNDKLKELDKLDQLDTNFKFLYAISQGNDKIGDIANFAKLEDLNEFEKLEELVKIQIIHKNPYRLSEIGEKILKFIISNIKRKISLKFLTEETLLEDISNNEFTRILCNLLMKLSLLTIKNRIEIGRIKDFKEFDNLYIDPNTYS